MLAYWLFCIFCKLEFRGYRRLRKTTLETQITYLYLRGKKMKKKKKNQITSCTSKKPRKAIVLENREAQARGADII